MNEWDNWGWVCLVLLIALVIGAIGVVVYIVAALLGAFGLLGFIVACIALVLGAVYLDERYR